MRQIAWQRAIDREFLLYLGGKITLWALTRRERPEEGIEIRSQTFGPLVAG